MPGPTKHPYQNLALILAESALLVDSAVPLYLIGSSAAKSVVDVEGLSEINGIFCASITFVFLFQFLQKEKKELPRQWRIAGFPGKFFIAGISLSAALSAGLPNVYYMTGNKAFKVVAWLMPAIAPRAIFSDWLLRANLWIMAKVFGRFTKLQNVHQLYELLRIFSQNIKFNSTVSSDLNVLREKYGITAGAAIKANQGNREVLKNLKSNLESLEGHDEYIKPAFDCSLLSLMKIAIVGTGFGAAYLMYSKLSFISGKCVIGSGFENDFNGEKPSCPIQNDEWANIGYHLGYPGFGFMTSVTIFPMLALADAIRFSWNNERKHWTTFLISALLAIFRSSISIFVAEQNDNSSPLFSLIYVAGVFFFYNFFSLAYYGPPTLKQLFCTVSDAIKSLCSSNGEEPERLIPAEEVNPANTANACYELMQQCLFHPFTVKKALEDNCPPENNYRI